MISLGRVSVRKYRGCASKAMARKFTQKLVTGGKREPGTSLELLSDRELEVFKQIGRGKSTREIAASLRLSVKTIETYREHLKVKLELPNGAALSRCAILWLETVRLS